MRDWNEFFKPEDFGLDDHYNHEDSSVQLTAWEAAKTASALLRAALKEAPKVDFSDYEWELLYDEKSHCPKGGFTAKLVAIKEIK